MSAFKSLSLTGASVLLVAIANGCSQFPSLLQPDPSARSTASGNAHSVGVMQLGEDPDAFQSSVDPARRRANVLLTRARLAMADGDTDTALQLLESILKADPDHAEASHLTAVLRTRSGDLEAAEAHFRTALAADGDNPLLNSDYGYFCYLAGRWDDAERFLTRAAEIDPELPQAQTNLGMLKARRGNSAAARRHFRNAGCTDVEVLNNLALARFLEEDFAAAETMYRQAHDLDPGHRNVNDGLRMTSQMTDSFAGERGPAMASFAVGSARVGDR